MSSSTIFLLFSIEAALLGFLGSIVGILLAWGSGFVVNYIFRQQKFFGFEGVDLLSFNIVQMLWIVLGLVIVGLIAGVFPAIKAAKLDPITALTTE
jgi:putative ABC transport system permease protein